MDDRFKTESVIGMGQNMHTDKLNPPALILTVTKRASGLLPAAPQVTGYVQGASVPVIHNALLCVNIGAQPEKCDTAAPC